MINMMLSEVLKFLFPKTALVLEEDVLLSQMTLDSRNVVERTLFVAIKGHKLDGRQFISMAIDKGTAAILAQADESHPSETIEYQKSIAIIYVDQLNEKLSALGSFFYRAPSQKQQVIGVTGTNGKTTVTQLIAQWAALLGQKTAILGTIGNGILGKLTPSENTTSDAIEIQKQLAIFEQQHVELTAMEVSSHGLVQGRVDAVSFCAAVFTNLSRDHLDYHGNMQQYEAAKLKLFTQDADIPKIINVDDDVGARWCLSLPNVVAVSTKNHLPSAFSGRFVCATEVSFLPTKARINIISSWGSAMIESQLIGEFNVSNLLVSLATLLSLGRDFNQLAETASRLQPICGRMERFLAPNKPTIIVDYAHTPDALEKALDAARIHCHGKLWCIFGCGGDRDRGKRPLMAAIAESFADYVIVTDDNPRTEDATRITDDVLQGFIEPGRVFVIHSRYEAISYALSQSSKDDMILVAGKGHEDYQVIGHNTVHYSDRESAAVLLGIVA